MTLLSLFMSFAQVPSPEPQLEEKLLARVPEKFSIEARKEVSPDGTSSVTTEFSVVWSPEGSAVGYIGEVGDVPYPVLGDNVGEAYHYASPPTFSADGKHSAFRVGKRIQDKKERWWILFDGRERDPQDWIGEVRIAPDGVGFAAWCQPGAKIASDGSYTRGAQQLITPWKLGGKWEDADSLYAPRFSDDGTFVCALAAKSGQWGVLIADKKGERVLGPTQSLVSGYDVSANGKVCALEAFAAGDGSDEMPPPMPGMPGAKSVVVFGKETFGKQFDSAGSPKVSADGKQVAWVLHDKQREGVAFGDGKQSKPCADWVRGLSFRPDGRELAFFAGNGGSANEAMMDPAGQPMIDGAQWSLARVVPGPGAAKIEEAKFSNARALTWSQDGKLLAFSAQTKEGWRIVCGETKSEPFDEVGPPRFSADGKHIGFGARTGRELWWKVLALP